MTRKILIVAILGAGLILAPHARACSLEPPDILLLKKAMAGEIAFRLAIKVEQVALDDITTPELQRPLALGPDCSGLASFHHSAGFRVALATQQHVFATMGKPQTAAGAGARYRARFHAGLYSSRPWAGVQRNFWLAPRPQSAAGVEDSGYMRWPQYPTERRFAASQPPMSTPQRWSQYADESVVDPRAQGVSPERWTTFSAVAAQSLAPGLCRYEGVAVVLGYDSTSPVAVNFTQQCD